jgi:ABC-type transport system involved in cytochrome c biogenesis ATPase subunit
VKFEFQNLGTIKKTTLDLRPLTVIVGPNNSSKTYLAYCVHGLIQALQGGLAFQSVPPSGAVDIQFDLSEVTARARVWASHFAKKFTEGLPEYFQDTYGGLFKETRLDITPDEVDVRVGLERLGLVEDARVELSGDRVILGGNSKTKSEKMRLLNQAATSLLTEPTGHPLTLPAERNAFIITYKMLGARRYRILRDRERSYGFRRRTTAFNKAGELERAVLREQGDIRYPAPVEEFLDFLTDVELNASRPNNDQRSPLGKLAHLIETHLQSGHRTGFEATKLGGSELAVTISEKLRLDLYNASSSIKQVAPLLLYLRYRAAPNQTLIIDEPEMNLHPEGQAKLLEALAMLANLGVRVLLTTHSPYFMAHLNNLIASDPTSAARKKRQAKHLYMGDPAAFLSPDDVSAYEMRPEGLHSLADPEYGIRWDTLSDVSSELQRRYFAIVEEPKGRAKAK